MVAAAALAQVCEMRERGWPISWASLSIAILINMVGSCAAYPFMISAPLMQLNAIYSLILPRNLRDEIMQQMRHIADWGGKFVVPIPKIEVIDPREPQS